MLLLRDAFFDCCFLWEGQKFHNDDEDEKNQQKDY